MVDVTIRDLQQRFGIALYIRKSCGSMCFTTLDDCKQDSRSLGVVQKDLEQASVR